MINLEAAGKFPLASRSYLKNHVRVRIIPQNPKITQKRKKKKKRLCRVTRNKKIKSLLKMISLKRSLSTLISRICGAQVATGDQISRISSRSGL